MIVLNIFAMRRSGQHGIINWIIENVSSKLAIDYDDCKFPDNIDDEVKTANRGKYKREKFAEENHKLVVCNCEDCFVADYSRWFSKDVDYRKSVILRDPYNTIASRIKGGHTHGRFGKDLDMWKLLAKDALKDDIFCINYNKWFVNKEYRKSIISYLGFNFNDKGLECVKRGVSSFDAKNFNGKAQQMDVFNRWKIVNFLHKHWDLFDKEIEELCIKHFNFYIDRKNKEVIE